MKILTSYIHLVAYLLFGSLFGCNSPQEPEALLVKPVSELRTNTGQRVRISHIDNTYKSIFSRRLYQYNRLNRLEKVSYESNIKGFTQSNSSLLLYQQDIYQYNTQGQVTRIDRSFSSTFPTIIYSPTTASGNLIYRSHAERADFVYDTQSNLTNLTFVTDTTGKGTYMPLYNYVISYNEKNVPLKTIKTAPNVTITREYVVADSNIVQTHQTVAYIPKFGTWSFNAGDNGTDTYKHDKRQRIFFNTILYDFIDIDFFSRDDSMRGNGYVIDDRGLLIRYEDPISLEEYHYEVY